MAIWKMKKLARQVTEERRNYFLNDAEKLIYTNGGKTRSLSHKNKSQVGLKKAKSRRQNYNTIRGKRRKLAICHQNRKSLLKQEPKKYKY